MASSTSDAIATVRLDWLGAKGNLVLKLLGRPYGILALSASIT